MKLNRKTIIISSIIFLLVALSIVIATVIKSNLQKPSNLLKVLQDNVDLQIKGFVYTEVGEHNVKWEVRSETATYDKKNNLAVLEMVKIKLTTAGGNVFEMRADQGRMLTKEKIIEIKGNVVITSDEGDKLSTDHLSYNDGQKKFYTDAPVAMENKRMKLTGKGLALYLNRGELSVPSMVKAKIH